MSNHLSAQLCRTLILLEQAKDYNYFLEMNSMGGLEPISWFSYLRRKVSSLFIGTEQAFSHDNPLPVAQKVEAVFSTYQSQLERGEALLFQYFFQSQAKSAREKGVKAKIQEISQKVFSEVTIKPKLNLVEKAIKYLDNQSWLLQKKDMQKARDYFYQAKERLQKNKNVCLPEWYHATRNHKAATSILYDGKVKQNHAFKGYGAFISSNDEAGNLIGYGPITLAFDGEFVEHSSAAFFVPNPDHHLVGKLVNWSFGWPRGSVWARVAQDLPVNRDTVAYVVTDKGNSGHVKKALRDFHPKIPCVSRNVSKIIFSALTSVTPPRKVPYKWNWMECEDSHVLPKGFSEV